MFEDKLLVFRCKRGSKAAMRVVYENHKDHLLTMARALLDEPAEAEDVVHDVFVSFARSLDGFRLKGSLRGFLSKCVINRARDRLRKQKTIVKYVSRPPAAVTSSACPQQQAVEREEEERLRAALRQLPYEQREAVVLRLKNGMTLRRLARLQGVSLSTAQGRYRYGLQKLRSLLNSETME
ncbi:MAG: RNA polymerase sigma factor [Planctomycetota bacterium]|jgi:RNA polymerase sigma-70 factor (ECF subfamily)